MLVDDPGEVVDAVHLYSVPCIVDDRDIGIAGRVDEFAQRPPHVGDLEITLEIDRLTTRLADVEGKAKAASAILADFKTKAFGDIGAFVEMSIPSRYR